MFPAGDIPAGPAVDGSVVAAADGPVAAVEAEASADLAVADSAAVAQAANGKRIPVFQFIIPSLQHRLNASLINIIPFQNIHCFFSQKKMQLRRRVMHKDV